MKKSSLDRIKKIHQLSQKLNKKKKKDHQRQLLKLMHSHIDEIEELSAVQDKHFLVETGDLMILCFELILENKSSVNKMILRCCERYEKKLKELMKEV